MKRFGLLFVFVLASTFVGFAAECQAPAKKGDFSLLAPPAKASVKAAKAGRKAVYAVGKAGIASVKAVGKVLF